MQQGLNTKKYILVFFITLGIFALIFLLSDYLYNHRISQVKTIEENINRNILESEIQYALLADASCEDGGSTNASLINELNTLTKRLEDMEDQRGADDPEVISLKKYYSLLQIKDYLLMRERTKQCGEKPLSIIYFYSNAGDCTDCKKMGYVLKSMRGDYANLHVYAFDYNIGLSVIETLKSMYKLENKFPVLIINRKPYYGFKTRGQIEELIPELTTSSATSTATSTKR
jgi:hypothetical protein